MHTARLWVIRDTRTNKFVNNTRQWMWEEHDELQKARFFREKHFASSSLTNRMAKDVWKAHFEILPVEVTLADSDQ